MQFSIVTPSFRSSQWLRLCVASVADQQGVTFEHVVQDSCSDDGTQDWLPNDKRVRAFIEKDQGMYDAVNRGFRRATGDILAYLNCDEQFLPGALQSVARYFAENPSVEAVVSDTLVTGSDGQYICSRYSLVPRKHQMWVRFPVLSCGLFIRRSVLQERGVWLDTRWRDLGDFFWVREMVVRGVKMCIAPVFTSIFTDTGENMNLKPNAMREREEKDRMAPAWVKICRQPIVALYRLRLAARGALNSKPFRYSIYTLKSPQERVTYHVEKPTSFWKGRRGS